MAKPIVVERILRSRFENDDKLHAGERAKTEKLRATLLAAAPEGAASSASDALYSERLGLLKTAGFGSTSELSWKLTPRPAEAQGTPATAAPPSTPTQNTAKGGVYSIEATAQIAQVLSPSARPGGPAQAENYFEDLPRELQPLLNAQLEKSGAVSAVVETAQGFLLYLGKNRTREALLAAVFSLPKRSYDEWLAAQPEAG